MQKTEHYQLNQWEMSDRIMMEDFNADNEKIDAALAGLGDGQLTEKLLAVTTSESIPQLDLDVSAIDFTQYAEIKLYCYVPLQGANVQLRLNGLTGYVYCRTYCGSMQNDSVSNLRTDTLAYWRGAIDRNPSVNLNFHTPIPGAAVTCDFTFVQINANRYEYDTYAAGAQTVTWDTLESLNFSCLSYSGAVTDLPAGTEIILYGVRK